MAPDRSRHSRGAGNARPLIARSMVPLAGDGRRGVRGAPLLAVATARCARRAGWADAGCLVSRRRARQGAARIGAHDAISTEPAWSRWLGWRVFALEHRAARTELDGPRARRRRGANAAGDRRCAGTLARPRGRSLAGAGADVATSAFKSTPTVEIERAPRRSRRCSPRCTSGCYAGGGGACSRASPLFALEVHHAPAASGVGHSVWLAASCPAGASRSSRRLCRPRIRTAACARASSRSASRRRCCA